MNGVGSNTGLGQTPTPASINKAANLEKNSILNRLGGVGKVVKSLSNAMSGIGKKEISQEAQTFRSESKDEGSLYKMDFVCKKIVKKLGNDPQKAIAIINDLSSSKDVRFNSKMKGVGEFTFPKKEILDELEGMKKNTISQEKTNKVGTKKLGMENSDSPAFTDKEKKMVAMQLVGLVTREDKTSDFQKAGVNFDDEKPVSITQHSCHAETDNDGKVKLSNQKSAVSAELPKEERNVRTLPNTGYLTSGNKVLCFRSAKTHKTFLQEQRSKADIAARVQVSKEKLPGLKEGVSLNGLTRNKDGTFDYQPVIFTMMDANPVKAIGTSAQGLVKRAKLAGNLKFGKAKGTPIENEQKFLEKMIKSNNDRFKDKAYIEHTIEGGVTVREYPAIIQNHVFSSQSKNAENRQQAREQNIEGQMQMLNSFFMKKSALFEETFIESGLPAMGQNPSEEQMKAISDGLKTAYANASDSTEKLVIEAFHANLFGTSIGNEEFSYDEPHSGGDLAMLTGIQSDYLGLSFSPQCKSGNDRTIAATAHKVAQEAWLGLKGKYFDPSSATPAENDEYNTMYKQALNDFGLSNVEASRGPVDNEGKSGIKVKHSPSVLHRAKELLWKAGVLQGSFI